MSSLIHIREAFHTIPRLSLQVDILKPLSTGKYPGQLAPKIPNISLCARSKNDLSTNSDSPGSRQGSGFG